MRGGRSARNGVSIVPVSVAFPLYPVSVDINAVFAPSVPKRPVFSYPFRLAITIRFGLMREAVKSSASYSVTSARKGQTWPP